MERDRVVFRAEVALFKGKYIVFAVRTTTLRRAEWLAQVWSKQNAEGRFKYHAKVVPDLPSHMAALFVKYNYTRMQRRDYLPSQHPEWMLRLSCYHRDELVRVLWIEVSTVASVLGRIWQSQSRHNSFRVTKLTRKGWRPVKV